MEKNIKKFNKFWWCFFSIGTRVLFIYFPIISIFLLINSQENNFLVKVLFQISKLLLGIFLLFNIFIKPNNTNSFIPGKTETTNQQSTYFMYFAVTTVLYVNSLLSLIEQSLLGETISPIPWYLHLVGILYSLLFVRELLKKTRNVHRPGTGGKKYGAAILAGKATKKIYKHLSKREIQELEELILVEAEINTYTVNYLGKLVFFSVILALVLGVITELIGRGYLNLFQ